MAKVSFPDEAVLFNKGESSANLYALESGVVKICCTTSDGREQIVGISSPGSLLVGLQSINDDCYEYSAVAATPLTACKISHRALLQKAASDGHVSMRLVAALNAQLAQGRLPSRTHIGVTGDDQTWVASGQICYEAHEFRGAVTIFSG